MISFLEKVQEPVEPTETISIEEFRNLPCHGTLEVFEKGGGTIGEEAHKKQCESVKVGDKVFFFERIPDISDLPPGCYWESTSGTGSSGGKEMNRRMGAFESWRIV